MNIDQLFSPRHEYGEDDKYFPQAGVMLLIADALYRNQTEVTPDGSLPPSAFLLEVLSAANAGGFKVGDILLMLLARDHFSHPTLELAQQALEAAGPVAIRAAFERASSL